jgi:hypothetical protein
MKAAWGPRFRSWPPEVRMAVLLISWAAASLSGFLGAMFYTFTVTIPKSVYTHLVEDRLWAGGFFTFSLLLIVFIASALAVPGRAWKFGLLCVFCLAATCFGALTIWRMMGL